VLHKVNCILLNLNIQPSTDSNAKEIVFDRFYTVDDYFYHHGALTLLVWHQEEHLACKI